MWGDCASSCCLPGPWALLALGWTRSSLHAGQVLSLRGGGEEYDSKNAEKFDRVLWDMLAQHPDEIYFLNTVFNFLQRRTPCFNGPLAERNYQVCICLCRVLMRPNFRERRASSGYSARFPDSFPTKRFSSTR